MTTRGVILKQFGPPSESLEVGETAVPAPGPGEIAVDMLAAPINPADLNIIEGAYGELPELPAVIGNEGAGRVTALGSGVEGLSPGDLVAVLRRGTWARKIVVPAAEAFRVARDADPFQAAMLAVNPPTALLLLESFVQLQPGDWVVQNAANSAVGRSVIQIARALGLKTLNIVRRESLVTELKSAGADVVVLEDCDLRKRTKELCGGRLAKLGLNAVGGSSALNVANALEPGSPHVTFGGMARQPLKIPNGLLIFKDLAFRGFWLTRWKAGATACEREAVFSRLGQWLADGRLKLPVHSTHPLDQVLDAVAAAAQGSRSGKVLLDLAE